MSLNGVMTLILRYFTEYGIFRARYVKVVEDVVVEKVHVRYLISPADFA